MDYLSAEYVICFMVCDCDIVLLLSDQCIAGTYMGIIQIYCIYFIWNDFYSNFCVYFVFYHRWSVRCLSEWITVFNVLYQFIYFLAYALTYPDMKVLLYFVIPIKMKWMAIVYAALVVYDIVRYFMGGAWFMALPIIASLLNFIIFFLGTRNLNRYNPKEIHRRNQFKRAMGESKTVPFPGGSKSGEVTKHKCAVCGRTEKDDPNLEFRFCSKCNGNYEYCQDHLYTHIHKK